jgi:predicted TIM-barrel fold metal-dependent hydrolase
VRWNTFTPRRAAALVAGLCAAALAAAILAATAVQRALPELSRVGPIHSAPLPLPRIDAHQHVGPATAAAALRIAALHGIGAVVNLSGGAAGAGLEAQLAAALPHGDRLIVFMNPDPAGCCGAGWAVREAERLSLGQALGARGVAFQISPGADLTVPAAKPFFEACAALHLPVSVSAQGAPAALVLLAERYPQVVFIGAHFAGRADEPAAVQALMDRLPNLWVDLAGRVAELGQHGLEAREAILAHSDRVLFGTDTQYVESQDSSGIILGAGDPILLDELLGGQERRIFFDSTLRFLESRDPGLRDPIPGHGEPDVSGLGLPREVLHRVYHQNAERLLRLRSSRVQG